MVEGRHAKSRVINPTAEHGTRNGFHVRSAVEPASSYLQTIGQTEAVPLPYGGELKVPAGMTANIIILLNEGINSTIPLTEALKFKGGATRHNIGKLHAAIHHANDVLTELDTGLKIVNKISRGERRHGTKAVYEMVYLDETKKAESVRGLTNNEAAIIAVMLIAPKITAKLNENQIPLFDDKRAEQILELPEDTGNQAASSKEDILILRMQLLQRVYRAIADGLESELIDKSGIAGKLLLESLPKSDSLREKMFEILFENVNLTNGIMFRIGRLDRASHASYGII